MSRLRLAVLMGSGLGLACVASPFALQAHDLPANARPGTCYGKVISPAVYGTTSRQVLVRKGWTETKRTAAIVDHVSRQVLVSPEVIERTQTPATYRTVVEWIEHPGEVRRVSEPARYDVVREKVQVEAGHAEWRRSDAPLAYGESSSGQTLVQGTGEVMCRVWVPARYETTQRRVLVSPGRSYEVTGPSRREKVVRRELVSPGGWTEHRRAAFYRTEWVDRVFRQASVRTIEHPAVYRTVESQTLVRPAREGWSRITCAAPKVAYSRPPAPVPAPPPPPPPPPQPAAPAHACGYCSFITAPPAPPPPPVVVASGHACGVCSAITPAPSPAFVARIQRALIGQGYDPGPADGEARPQTYAALRQFQNQRGLPQTGMTRETAQALGVE